MELNNRYGATSVEWAAQIDETKNLLISLAKDEKVISYSELAEMCSIVNFQQPYHDLAAAIGEVSEDENAMGCPLLSVLVIKKDTFQCGEGFFTLAENLGYEFDDKTTFQIQETKRCFDYWKEK